MGHAKDPRGERRGCGSGAEPRRPFGGNPGEPPPPQEHREPGKQGPILPGTGTRELPRRGKGAPRVGVSRLRRSAGSGGHGLRDGRCVSRMSVENQEKVNLLT